MRKDSTFVPFSVLNIDPESSVPVYRQLYTSLRNAILNGQLASGTQLPSTRALALALGQAIVSYIRSVRAVKCDPEQVIIVAGSQQALDLAARVLLDPGDDVLIEDPCYPGAKGALLGAGAHLIPVPVDNEGLRITSEMVHSAIARMAYVKIGRASCRERV